MDDQHIVVEDGKPIVVGLARPSTIIKVTGTGPQGQPGVQGGPGPPGETGPEGPQGDPGTPGNDGESGPQGIPGNDGPTGPQGDEGAQGNPGPEGPEGDVGPQGPEGDIGLQGEPGPQGPVGPVGPTGPTGTQGVKGDTGSTGPSGPAGPTGPAGTPALGSSSFVGTPFWTWTGTAVNQAVDRSYAYEVPKLDKALSISAAWMEFTVVTGGGNFWVQLWNLDANTRIARTGTLTLPTVGIAWRALVGAPITVPANTRLAVLVGFSAGSGVTVKGPSAGSMLWGSGGMFYGCMTSGADPSALLANGAMQRAPGVLFI